MNLKNLQFIPGQDIGNDVYPPTPKAQIPLKVLLAAEGLYVEAHVAWP